MALSVGISGFASYVPPFRVSLENWCAWTGNRWDKVAAVVGRSFRQPGAHESIYTMAANAVLRLIDQYDLDPRDVGYLALGTESSTDNATGAVIVRGMIDRALALRGQRRLARSCEVPEFKHACLGGIYALKAAARYIATDGRGKLAIVVCGDIAEYERGSSGEPTQGAGSIAMLLAENPQLLQLDLAHSGSASDFRGMDFRKPVVRHFSDRYAPNTQRYADFPVFNGRYSTFCYLDAVTHAARDMFERLGEQPACFYARVAAVFMHRPYHAMPIQGMTAMYVAGLAESDSGRDELRMLATTAGVAYEDALVEARASHDLFDAALRLGVDAEPYPTLSAIGKAARSAPGLASLLTNKMTLGSDTMRDLGNLYTASLPAWLAAGLEDACAQGLDLAGETVLAVGYGSGDAAEAMPISVVKGWRQAASRIGLRRSLEGFVELTREQYEARHDGQPVAVAYEPRGEFVVERVGQRMEATFQDLGIEYYRYVPATGATAAAAE